MLHNCFSNLEFLIIITSGAKDMVRGVGGWCRDHMEMSYLNLPDIMALMILGDYPQDLDKHDLLRATEEPPETLIQMIFKHQGGKTMDDVINQIKQVQNQNISYL